MSIRGLWAKDSMANSITGLKRQYSLDEVKVRRLETEYELVLLRIDFCLHRFANEKKSFYDLLVFYGGLSEFTRGLLEGKREFFRKDVEVYNAKVESESFDFRDRKKLAQILFFSSDYVRDVCKGTDRRRCFDFDVVGNKVCLNFSNVVVPADPLKDKELVLRKEELAEIAGEIRDDYPHVEYIFSVGWMWNMEGFKGLMPENFVKSLCEVLDFEFYGLEYWGQFVLIDGGLDKGRVKEFKRSWEFPYRVLEAECLTQDFFGMYLE